MSRRLPPLMPTALVFFFAIGLAGCNRSTPEEEALEHAREVGSEESLEAFLHEYPNGALTAVARHDLAGVRASSEPSIMAYAEVLALHALEPAAGLDSPPDLGITASEAFEAIKWLQQARPGCRGLSRIGLRISESYPDLRISESYAKPVSEMLADRLTPLFNQLSLYPVSGFTDSDIALEITVTGRIMAQFYGSSSALQTGRRVRFGRVEGSWQLRRGDWTTSGNFTGGPDEPPESIEVYLTGRSVRPPQSDVDLLRGALASDRAVEALDWPLLKALSEVCGARALLLLTGYDIGQLTIDEELVEELVAEMLAAASRQRAERAAELLIQINHPGVDVALLAALAAPLDFVFERLGQRVPLSPEMLRAQMMFIDGPRQEEGREFRRRAVAYLLGPRNRSRLMNLARDGKAEAIRAGEILGLDLSTTVR